MNDRRWGEKPQPVKHYDTTKPIRGRIIYEDGTESQFTYARMVNGRERLPVRVVIDGVRYVRAKERDWDSE